jgi:hypothetical protein
MAPKGTAGKVAAATYLVACAAVLAFAIAGRDIRDTDIVVAYAMLLLSFPAGYVVAALFGAVGYVLFEGFGIVVPGGLANNAVAVVAFAVVGYAQWFIGIPLLYRKIKGAI